LRLDERFPHLELYGVDYEPQEVVLMQPWVPSLSELVNYRACAPDTHAAPPPQQYQQQPPPPYTLPQVPYGLPADTIPPSTLPQGWISQYDPTKQRLFYVYPQTNHVTWAHPLGPAADAQEQARFHQIMQMQQQRYGGQGTQKGYYESYNRQGGMGTGAALAMGMVGGKYTLVVYLSKAILLDSITGAALGMMAGSMMAHTMYNPVGFDTVPAETAVPAESFGGDFGGGDFGGGDFGF
ncbi:hypothetical protein BGW42_003537, partial [Actinomortierella wolfii]